MRMEGVTVRHTGDIVGHGTRAAGFAIGLTPGGGTVLMLRRQQQRVV